MAIVTASRTVEFFDEDKNEWRHDSTKEADVDSFENLKKRTGGNMNKPHLMREFISPDCFIETRKFTVDRETVKVRTTINY